METPKLRLAKLTRLDAVKYLINTCRPTSQKQETQLLLLIHNALNSDFTTAELDKAIFNESMLFAMRDEEFDLELVKSHAIEYVAMIFDGVESSTVTNSVFKKLHDSEELSILMLSDIHNIINFEVKKYRQPEPRKTIQPGKEPWELRPDPLEQSDQQPQLQPNKPKIVTLCGSSKFRDEFYHVNRELTLKGYIVLSLGVFSHSEIGFPLLTDDEKIMLDELHFRKIDMSDEIHVINRGGYIGDSTRREIEYALKFGIQVTYMEEPENV